MGKGHKDKVAVITGAGAGIGQAFAKRLAEDGVHIVIADTGPTEDTVKLVKAAGREALVVKCDVSSQEDVAKLKKETEQKFGRADILVNNAGIYPLKRFEEMTFADWRHIMSINLDAHFLTCHAFIPGMKARGWGRIINVCSLAAKTGGLTAGTAYATSKGAMTSLTFSLARESAAHGVTVNGISPAYVKTPMITEGLNEAQRRHLLSQIPVGRFCEPEEFAHAVRFLASPLAGFITGEIVDVNGGLQMD